jgi:transposase InsO family protein
VKVFQSDNGEEFVSAAFTKELQDAGIERQLASPYAHQQNRKAKRAIRTLQGHALAMLGHLHQHSFFFF